MENSYLKKQGEISRLHLKLYMTDVPFVIKINFHVKFSVVTCKLSNYFTQTDKQVT